MKGEIIALEGVCCAGKSTLTRQLARELRAATVPELPEFGRALFKPFTNSENILSNGRKSVGLEIARMQVATIFSGLARHVLMDRSYISALAINFGACDIIGEEKYRGLAKRIFSAMAAGDLFVPDRVLYISVNSATVQSRNMTRVPPLEPYWIDPERIERQKKFYDTVLERSGIFFIDGMQSNDAVLGDCLDAIHTTQHNEGQSMLNAFRAFVAGIQ